MLIIGITVLVWFVILMLLGSLCQWMADDLAQQRETARRVKAWRKMERAQSRHISLKDNV